MTNQDYTENLINFLSLRYICEWTVKSNFNEQIKKSFDRWSDDFDEGINKCKSPIEKIMYSILKQNDCIDVFPQHKIDKYIVDFLVSIGEDYKKIIIECDGHDFHEKTKEQAKHDKERDRYLISKGYPVFRFTGSEIYNNPLKVLQEIDNIIDSQCRGGNDE